jgi:hypothetical protein
MAKNSLRRGLDEQLLEGGGGGGSFRSMPSSTLNPRPTGSRSSKDYKEKADRESEFSGEMSFGSPRGRSSDSSDRTPRMSDDYAKGGMTASSRADGCATKGKTKGKFV